MEEEDEHIDKLTVSKLILPPREQQNREPFENGETR